MCWKAGQPITEPASIWKNGSRSAWRRCGSGLIYWISFSYIFWQKQMRIHIISKMAGLQYMHTKTEQKWKENPLFLTSVADPDPPDPHVFGPPGSGSISQRYGSGSGSFYHPAVRKILIPTALWLLLDFLSLKMMYKYLQKVISKKTFKNLFCWPLGKVNDENSRIRIRIRIHYSEAWIRGSRYGSGSTPKCHGSATLFLTLVTFLWLYLWRMINVPSKSSKQKNIFCWRLQGN